MELCLDESADTAYEFSMRVFHMCGWQGCFTSGECEISNIPTSKVTQCGCVSMRFLWFVSIPVCVSVCVFVLIKIGGEMDRCDSQGGTESVYLQYSPEWVFIFRRQNNLFTF